MARGPFRREDAGNNATASSSNEKDYYSNIMPARNVKVVPTKGPAENRKDRDATKWLDQDPRHKTDEPVEQQHQQERFGHKQQRPPTSFVNIRNNTSSFQTVTSEITMLADLLEDDPPPAREEVDDEMDQIMKRAMEDVLKFANDSQNNSDKKKRSLAAAKKNSTSYSSFSFGDISLGISSIINHKKRLNKHQNQSNEETSNDEDSPEIDENHSDSDFNGKSSNEPSSVGLPLDAKNDSCMTSHNDFMPSSTTGRSPSTSKAVTSNSTAKNQDQEEYTDRDIDAIIELKLQVANQRTTIDYLSSELNRALSEKKELEKRIERIQQQQQEEQEQQQEASLMEGNTMINSGLRQLRSMTYKAAASSIFSSFAAHPIDEETLKVAVESQSISQQTSRTANITQPSPQSQTQQQQEHDPSASQYSILSSISARWSREKVGSTSTQSIRSSSQHEQRSHHPHTTTTYYDDSPELQSQVHELQSTLAKQFSSCADSSYLSSAGSNRGQNGADGNRSIPSNHPTVQSALSSQGRIIDSIPLSESKEGENKEDFCLSTESSTKDLCEEKQVNEEVLEPIIVETKMI